MFSFMRYGGYGRYGGDSSDDETPSSGFTLRRGGEEAGSGDGRPNAALQRALMEAAEGKIELEVGADDEDMAGVEAAVAAAAEWMCVECRDQPALVSCKQCEDNFCDVCFAAVHRSGTRAKHSHTPFTAGHKLNEQVNKSSPQAQANGSGEAMEQSAEPMDESSATPALTESSSAAAAAASPDREGSDISDEEFEEAYRRSKQSQAAAAASSSSAAAASKPAATSALDSDDDTDSEDDARSARSGSSDTRIQLPTIAINSSLMSGAQLPEDFFLHRARFIPIRLTLEERKFLRLLEATLQVSEYTDKIDIISSKSKTQRIKEQLRDLCSILSGLVVANDYKLGQQLIKDKDFEDNAAFFQNVFELGRRHKIRNPEKMRSAYGKLVFIVMDSVNPQIEEMMGFNLHGPLRTVYAKLEAAGPDALALLRDPLLMQATADIKTDGRQRPEIERDIKAKNAAQVHLARKYSTAGVSEEDVKMCVLSIADNTTFLLQNRFCCDQMLSWLTESFHPTQAQAPFSLAILGGRQGARLTHSHASQYSYVMQSLTLWREIIHHFFELWVKTESDLFDPNNPYRLTNTGQGLNRRQSAPRVGKTMHNILHACQRKLGSWVGSSVIHLGDSNVPNALFFIDKYTQVSRILNPICLTIKAIPRLCEKPDIKLYIDAIFGGPEKLKMLILTDFFRHAFDGSGADDWFSAGSCIDGRLTSAWNWCNKIEKKSYHSIFQLAGFASFDGQWSD